VDDEKIKEIERIVNDIILAQLTVQTDIYLLEEAKKNPKIKMFFGDKYGDEVRAISVGDFSLELCGGTHCKNSSEIAFFKIISESSIAAGIRRIEAVTGKAAYEYVVNLEKQLQEKLVEFEDLKVKIKHFEKAAEKMKKANIDKSALSMAAAKKVNDLRVLVMQMDLENLDQLRITAENARETFGTNGIFLVASIIEDKVQLACSVTDDLKSKYPAGKLVGEAAKILGGGGGGKPHLATAGGKDISKLNDLLETNFYKIVEGF
jgi:alanyl-tRNA synthetase